MEDDLACELFLEADKLLNGSIYLQKAINKSQEYREYCPNNKQCSTRAESIGALSVYLFTNFYNKESGYYEHFIMWLAHTLFKIAKKRNNENAHNITLSSAYDKYLDKSMGHLRQWDILNDVRGVKDPNLRYMSELYTLLNHICNTIAYYKKNHERPVKLRQHSVKCFNQYRNLYEVFSGNDSYLSLLEKLKKIYDDFRTAAIKNDIGKKNNIESRLLELTEIKKKESHSTNNFKILDSNGPEDQLEDEKDPEIPKEKSTQEEQTYHKAEGKNIVEPTKLQNTVDQRSIQREEPSVSGGTLKTSGNESENSGKSQGVSIEESTKENLTVPSQQPQPPHHHQSPQQPQIHQAIQESLQPQHTPKNGIDSHFVLKNDEFNSNDSKDQLEHEKQPEIPKENSTQEMEKYHKIEGNNIVQPIKLQNTVDQIPNPRDKPSVSEGASKISRNEQESNGKFQGMFIEPTKENLSPKSKDQTLPQELPSIIPQPEQKPDSQPGPEPQPEPQPKPEPEPESQHIDNGAQPASTQEKSLTSYETIKKITETEFLYDFYKLHFSSFYKNLTKYGNRLYESTSTSLTKGYSAFNNFANDLITQPNKINVTSQSVDNSIQTKDSGSDSSPPDDTSEMLLPSSTQSIDKKIEGEKHEINPKDGSQKIDSEGQGQVIEGESKGQISETEGGTQEANPEDGIHETSPKDESHETNLEGETQEKELEDKGKISENGSKDEIIEAEESIPISTPNEPSGDSINITLYREIEQLPSGIKVQNGIFEKGFPGNLFKESKFILYPFIVIAILVMLAVIYKCLGFGRRKKEKKKKKMKKIRKMCDENNTEKLKCIHRK
ncbi:YIR protein [Plasmodium yoelii]|uniref:YIR protein n=1 Tax=Plasmodium yoelii TaxID=5861 RepID=A0A077Y0T9_PLAYE|nr:YIR protein [Plasmodium yoelii]